MPMQLPTSLNLLDPAEQPTSSWDKIYDWVFSVGRYIIIGVELVVLLAFAARFTYDRQNNDLKESIDVKVRLLQDQAETEARIRRTQALLNNFAEMVENQEIISPKLTAILDIIPEEYETDSISISQTSINFTGVAPTYHVVQALEDDLKEDPVYCGVQVTVAKGDVESDVDSTFNVQFCSEEEDGGSEL